MSLIIILGLQMFVVQTFFFFWTPIKKIPFSFFFFEVVALHNYCRPSEMHRTGIVIIERGTPIRVPDSSWTSEKGEALGLSSSGRGPSCRSLSGSVGLVLCPEIIWITHDKSFRLIGNYYLRIIPSWSTLSQNPSSHRELLDLDSNDSVSKLH